MICKKRQLLFVKFYSQFELTYSGNKFQYCLFLTQNAAPLAIGADQIVNFDLLTQNYCYVLEALDPKRKLLSKEKFYVNFFNSFQIIYTIGHCHITPYQILSVDHFQEKEKNRQREIKFY